MATPDELPARKRFDDLNAAVNPASTQRPRNKLSDIPLQNFGYATSQGAVGLLTLPPELRNRIYEIAFTTDSQFYYHSTFPTQAEVDFPDPLMAYVVDQPGTSTLRDTLKPLHAQLTVVTGREHTKTPNGMILYIGLRSYNQLQLVNRQLFQETKGLEFKYNNIVFTGSGMNRQATLEKMCTFVRKIQSSSTSCLTSITLIPRGDLIGKLCWRNGLIAATGSETFNRYANFLRETVSFCKQKPQLQLSYGLTPSCDSYTLGESYINLIAPDATFSRGLWNFVVLGMLASISFAPRGVFAQSAKADSAIRDDPFVQQAKSYAKAFDDRGMFTDVKNLTFYQGNPQLTQEIRGLGEIRSTAFVGGQNIRVLQAFSTEV
ncbi:hypothetical protein P171DRAFT_443506 [Karstenula rhodostoma CBS 690.94]|uniref:Uncharacterized protein n=1 Tax=Karstenula rhodostoma CBS 690.94 TaxID=1392251 RepID=A0A9P4UD92_9PLEO|nr:hypothetical protein P171DRAFT_443506 [Karstenula rhodostoma CBS 690.94]